MKLCQFYLSETERDADLGRRRPRSARLGVVQGEMIVSLRSAPVGLDLPDFLEAIDGRLGDAAEATDERFALADVALGPPVLRPRALLDFYTFEQHVKTCRAKRGLEVPSEWYAQPVYYNSNPSALYGHGQRVLFPSQEDRLDYELELACVLGRAGRNVREEEAERIIAGYTILNDWSARSLQRQVMAVGLGPAPGKDHASSLGPMLVTPDELPDVRELGMRAYVNGQLWSEGRSGASHYTFGQMIAFASRSRTLFPGDVVGSGTVGTGCGLEQDRFLQPGDRVRLEIDGIGALENEVGYESAA